MEEVKRFSLCVSDGFSTMELRNEGTYVLFSDHVSVVAADEKKVNLWKEKYESLSLKYIGLFNANKSLRACGHEMRNCCNCCHSDIDIENIEKPVVPFFCEKWGEQFKDVLPCEHWDMRESKLGGYEKNKLVSVGKPGRIDCE